MPDRWQAWRPGLSAARLFLSAALREEFWTTFRVPARWVPAQVPAQNPDPDQGPARGRTSSARFAAVDPELARAPRPPLSDVPMRAKLPALHPAGSSCAA